MERNGFQGFEAAEIAAHSTRDKEDSLARRGVCAPTGSSPPSSATRPIKSWPRRAPVRSLVSEQQRPEHVATRAQEAVTFARDKIFEREAVGDERGIFRDALRRGMGELRYPEIRIELRGPPRYRRVSGGRRDQSTLPAAFSPPGKCLARSAT